MTGQGGWPMSVFLTPEQKPFFGGTYWPPRARGGMAGFGDVVSAVAAAWRDRRDDVAPAGGKGRAVSPGPAPRWATSRPSWTRPRWKRPETHAGPGLRRPPGRFRPAPKFPHATDLNLLLARWRAARHEPLLEMVVVTLDHMAAGGIYDHLGGGFHRYSVDAEWLVPHFEKMLYDNAMLASCYLTAWQETERKDYLRVVRETLDYVLRDMTDPLGGFYSAEDADSEGEEGRFYVWTPQEVQAVLGPERAAAFCRLRRDRARQFRRSQYPAPRQADRRLRQDPRPRCRRAGGAIGGRSRRVARGPRPPRAARPRRQGARELERADDRRPGPGRRRVGRTALPHGRRARRRLSADAPPRRAGAIAALLARGPGPAQRLSRRPCQPLQRPGDALRNAGGSRAGWRKQDGLADAMLARLPTPRRAASTTPPPTTSRSSPARRTSGTRRFPAAPAWRSAAFLRLARHTGRDDYRRAAEETLRVSIAWMERAALGVGQLLLGLDAWLAEGRAALVK